MSAAFSAIEDAVVACVAEHVDGGFYKCRNVRGSHPCGARNRRRDCPGLTRRWNPLRSLAGSSSCKQSWRLSFGNMARLGNPLQRL